MIMYICTIKKTGEVVLPMDMSSNYKGATFKRFNQVVVNSSFKFLVRWKLNTYNMMVSSAEALWRTIYGYNSSFSFVADLIELIEMENCNRRFLILT